MSPRPADGSGDGSADEPRRSIRFSAAVHDAVVLHARTGAPEEVCGVLGGTRGTTKRGAKDGTKPGAKVGTKLGANDEERAESVVRSVHRTANVAERPRTEYRIDPAEQYDAMREIEAGGDEIVGFYHSHPTGPPRPSATDRDSATWSGYSYVIVALDGDAVSVGSWRWTGEAFERETVVVE